MVLPFMLRANIITVHFGAYFMYIRHVEINHIKGIDKFEMTFEEGKEAGWHVLIGGNGAGKSTIVRSIAAVLIGPDEIGQIRPYWDEWLARAQNTGSINLKLTRNINWDSSSRTPPLKNSLLINKFTFSRDEVISEKIRLSSNATASQGVKGNPNNFNWGGNAGWFSVAYGPFRRFTGGNSEWSKVYYSAPKAGAHLSIFGEDVALTEALEWFKELDRKRLKEKEISSDSKPEAEFILDGVKQFINSSNLLPDNAKFDAVNLDGQPEFIDANGCAIPITQLSDGYRSILSLTFELLRQLIRVYGSAKVFPPGVESVSHFDLPGVVLIDEIDAHLHPTWQTRIGQWFTKHFPELQFIVTSHSPLVCRACNKGSIWRLAVAGSGQTSGEVTGLEKDRLIYGDILDAYDTEVFGSDMTRGKAGRKAQKEYRDLKYKKIYGVPMSEEESRRLAELRTIFGSNIGADRHVETD